MLFKKDRASEAIHELLTSSFHNTFLQKFYGLFILTKGPASMARFYHTNLTLYLAQSVKTYPRNFFLCQMSRKRQKQVAEEGRFQKVTSLSSALHTRYVFLRGQLGTYRVLDGHVRLEKNVQNSSPVKKG